LFEDDGKKQLNFAEASSDLGHLGQHAPLAEQLRPTCVDDFVGQSHLLGPGRPLRLLIEQNAVTSMILWGPPGTGKTTLARMLALNADADLIALSAVLAGVKEVRAAIAEAQQKARFGRRTILFVDEVHRFNKAQQDGFLPHVENGTITFIGATTENPSFEVNQALLSRARVFVLKALQNEDLDRVIDRVQKLTQRSIEESARPLLIGVVDGDARRLINLFELAMQFTEGSIDEAAINSALGENVRRFDKGGDVFYEQISALHKSVRGSDPDAALYWFCRMLDGGADPRYIGRRLIRMASEEIGNADPRALELTLSAVTAYERLGSPEGELALAQASLYLASVPKSDAAYTAFSQTQSFVRENASDPVPLHLRNAPTAFMKDLGYAKGYRHAHAEETGEGAFAVGENYFPDNLTPQQFYFPKDQGLESKIRDRLARLKTLNQTNPNTDTEQ
jgi:putative ATPase